MVEFRLVRESDNYLLSYSHYSEHDRLTAWRVMTAVQRANLDGFQGMRKMPGHVTIRVGEVVIDKEAELYFLEG